MRPEARDKFLQLADVAAKAAGGTSLQDGIDLVRRILANLTAMFDAIRTPELLTLRLDETEVTPEQEWLLLAAVQFGPQLARFVLRRLHRNAEATLPDIPNRRPAVDAGTQVRLLSFVNDLHFNHGVELEAAKHRAAQRFRCGVRTVERYWRERKEILANGPKMQFFDLIEGLKKAAAEESINPSPLEPLKSGQSHLKLV